ncbi:MAG: glycosyltransferase [candidate division Zixibacteria bacterium]|nr:glycosyltransferase [candidate division Zixibacteria bacterium]
MPWQNDGHEEGRKEANDGPFISVVVPCRNEAAFIKNALEAVLRNDWPADRLEVLVVDGGSTDGTRDLVAEMALRDPRVKLVDNPGVFAGSAMKIGVAAARGDYISRVDAHARIPSYYFKAGVAILRGRPDIWAVGGPVDRVAAEESGRLVAAIASNIFATGNTPVRVGRVEGSVDAVLYPVWPREVFERVGEFDETLVRNQDDDFHYRLRRAGGIIYQTQKMRATYYVRGSVRQLLKQYNQYAFWKVFLSKKRGRVLGLKPFVPLAFFAALALALVAGFSVPYLWLAGGILAAAYLCADVAASTAVAARTGFRDFFKALAIFPAFHLTYAAGILAGVWHFYVRGSTPQEIINRGVYSKLTR